MQHFYENISGWFTSLDKQSYDKAVEKFSDGDIFVEIGSWKGRSACAMAANIINSGKQIKFYCVDTWRGSAEHQLGQQFEDIDAIKGRLFEVFLSNTKPVKNMINIIKKESVEAAKTFEDRSLSFVFIDASHDYENVKKDLNAWYPKVKKGGILAGHDFTFAPVRCAVTDFSTLHNLTVTGDGCWEIQL